MIEAVILDLDDTLYSEWSYIKQGFWAVADRILKDFELHLRYSSNDIYGVLKDIFFNYSRVNVFNYLNRLIPEIEIRESYIIGELLPTFRFSKRSLECYPDVKPILGQLDRTVKIGMVTNGNTEVQNFKIDLLTIRKYFEKIEISGDYSKEKAKPSTFMLHKLLNIFRVKPYNAIYIGDNPETDRCAIDIGCNYLRMIREDGMYNDCCYSNKKHPIISSLSKLPYYIENYPTR